MDSDSFHIVQLFQQGTSSSYRASISAYEVLPSPSPLVTLYAARAHLALSPPATTSALSLLSTLPPTLDTRAVTAFAQYLEGSKEEAVEELQEVLAELGEQGLQEDDEGRAVRSIVGSVFILEGEAMREEGVEVLREGVELGQDQECLAVLSHLYLSLNLPANSTKLLSSPSTLAWTSDSLLSQLLSARTNLASGPTQKYQDAYYVYEELKGMQGGRGEGTLAGVAVAQALLGRWDESTQAVDEAVEMNPTHPTSLANCVALALHTGKAQSFADGILANLSSIDPSHPSVVDLAQKESLFDEAASKFKVSVA
ncbi:coatomer protein complex, subunit epsilon [Pseudohyphozyma bogoriensis]|nr:coatomer protein complex, subunit epsilon [Pseudohyphozyma bogoriensis]